MESPLIITCGCGDTDAFAEDAYTLIFPKHPIPPIMTADRAEEEVLHTSAAYQKVLALTHATEKYAYLFQDGHIWDLLTGVQVE